MAQSNSMSKMARNAGAFTAAVGLLAFFVGVFGFAPKMVMIVGIGFIAISLAAFYAEEIGHRKLS